MTTFELCTEDGCTEESDNERRVYAVVSYWLRARFPGEAFALLSIGSEGDLQISANPEKRTVIPVGHVKVSDYLMDAAHELHKLEPDWRTAQRAMKLLEPPPEHLLSIVAKRYDLRMGYERLKNAVREIMDVWRGRAGSTTYQLEFFTKQA